MKGQRGITLVALIITIVVLILLALVAVNSMQQTNIMNYTKNAVGAWNAAVGNEINSLGNYEGYLNNLIGTDGTTPTETVNFSIALKNGDSTLRTLNYTAEKGMTVEEWVNSSYDTNDAWVDADPQDMDDPNGTGTLLMWMNEEEINTVWGSDGSGTGGECWAIVEERGAEITNGMTLVATPTQS